MPEHADFSRLKDTESKARRGEHGQWRRDFSRRFRQSLDGIYGEIRSGLQGEAGSMGAEISCGKGCTDCCQHFVSIPVSHAVVIADYLYSSEAAMAAFKRGYARWRQAIEDDPDAQALLTQLEMYSTMSAEVQAPPQELLSAYHRFTIPCAFLDGKKCAIYPVRPICCAAYFALSPSEYCRAESDIPATIFEVKPSQDSLRRMSQLTDPRLSWHQEPLPELVYKLLTAGVPEAAEEVFKLFDAEAPAQSPPENK